MLGVSATFTNRLDRDELSFGLGWDELIFGLDRDELIFGLDRDELSYPPHCMARNKTSPKQGSELSSSVMIPRGIVVALEHILRISGVWKRVMQWEIATPVGFPTCMRPNDCGLKNYCGV